MRWPFIHRKNFDIAMRLFHRATENAQRRAAQSCNVFDLLRQSIAMTSRLQTENESLRAENEELKAELQQQSVLASRLVETIDEADAEFLRQVGARIE